jgi:hypothetical protein
MFCLYSLSVLLLLDFLPKSLAQDSGIVEIDLIFPQNNTYAPAAFMPVVLAVQNPHPARYLNMHVNWYVQQLVANENIQPEGTQATELIEGQDFNNNSIYFYTDAIAGIATMEASWEFGWRIETINCTAVEHYLATGGSYGNLTVPQYNTIIFSTKAGASSPNLVAASAEPACAANNQSFILDVTGQMNLTRPINETAGLHGGYTQCAALDTPSSTLTANPCVPTINASAASSISSAATFARCSLNSTQTAISCPPKKTSGSNEKLSHPGRLSLLTGCFGWIVYTLVH